MKQIKSMEVRGRVYETVQRNGKNIKIMSMRLVDGPVTLGVYTEPRTLFIPIPLAVGVTPLAAIPLKDKPHYYLRREGTCLEIPFIAGALSCRYTNTRRFVSNDLSK